MRRGSAGPLASASRRAPRTAGSTFGFSFRPPRRRSFIFRLGGWRPARVLKTAARSWAAPALASTPSPRCQGARALPRGLALSSVIDCDLSARWTTFPRICNFCFYFLTYRCQATVAAGDEDWSLPGCSMPRGRGFEIRPAFLQCRLPSAGHDFRASGSILVGPVFYPSP